MQVDSITARVEIAYGLSACSYDSINRFQTMLSTSTCAATPGLWFACMNYLVHSVMYTYYFLMAWGVFT